MTYIIIAAIVIGFCVFAYIKLNPSAGLWPFYDKTIPNEATKTVDVPGEPVDPGVAKHPIDGQGDVVS
jgi:hypothetical protein